MIIAQLTTDNREAFKEYGNPSPWFGTAPEALYQGFARTAGIQVHIITCTQRVMKSSPEKLAENIWFHSLHVPKIGWLRTGYQGCVRAVRRKVLELKPDIVHGQGTERDCAISAVLSGFPNVLTIHGNMRTIAQLQKARPFSFHWITARFEAWCLPRTNGVVCITRYTQQMVAPLAKRTWLLPNAVDERFFPINTQPAPSAPAQILYVGHIQPRKNQNAFIRALDPIAKQFPIKVSFLGDRHPGVPYDEEFMQLVQTRSWCSYEGFADRIKLQDYFRTASLVVLASVEDNCPMAVLEAMAAGVPVIAPNVGGVPDLVRDGENGLLCDPTDLGSIGNAVKKALSSRAAALERAAQAKREAEARFHPRVIADKHLEIYREVLWKRKVAGVACGL